MGRITELWNALNFMLSVTQIIFLLTCVTVSFIYHLAILSLSTLKMSSGKINNLVAGGNLDFNALSLLYYDTTVSASAVAICKALNLSFRFRLACEGPGNLGKMQYTESDGTSQLGPISSLIALIDILIVIRSVRNWSYFLTTSKILLSGRCNLSTFPVGVCACIELNCSIIPTSL